MIIPCFRCRKKLESPNNTNADYVMAKDMVDKEIRQALIALKHNQSTINSDLPVEDSAYDAIEIPNIEASKNIADLVKVIVEPREKDIQKTGIICTGCYKLTDTLIWGVHKEKV